jgi:hypothetical protein
VAIAIASGDSAAAIGASVAVNIINIDARAAVEDSTVTAGSVDISAEGSPVIDALTIAGAVSGSDDSLALGGAGAFSFNDINSTIEALIVDSTVTTTSGDLSLTATDGSRVNADAGAGAVAVAAGGDSAQTAIAVGAAAAVNEITTTARAAILDIDGVADVIIVAGAANLNATSTADIDAFTLGIAGTLTAGDSTGVGIAGAGSGSGNSVTNTIEAAVRGSTLVTGAAVRLEAQDNSTIDAIAGSASISITAGGGTNVGIGLGLSVTINDIDNDVLAIIDDSDITSGGDVTLIATSTATIDAIAFGAAVAVAAGSDGTGVAVGATGTVAENSITNTIRAAIEDSDTTSPNSIIAGGELSLNATDSSTIGAFGFAGSLSVGVGSTGISGSLGIGVSFNTIDNQVAAYIANVDTVDIDNGISISAMSDSAITANSIAAAVSVAVGTSSTSVGVSGGGAIAQNVILSATNAYIEDSDVNVGTPVIDAGIDIDANSM